MHSDDFGACIIRRKKDATYKWQSTISTWADLRLIHVDEDLRVPKGTSSTIARHHALLRPANGLLVNEFDGGQRSRLYPCALAKVWII